MKVLTETQPNTQQAKKPEPLWMRIMFLPAAVMITGAACVVLGAALGLMWGLGSRAFIWAWTFLR